MNIKELNILPEVIKAIDEMSYVDFTPVQVEGIPVLLNGDDLIAEAPTGTGKTAAYSLPMFSKINFESNDVQGLVICPTRELAVQVTKEINKFSIYIKNARTCVIYGGQRVDYQIKALKREPQIVVGTPGRMIDLIDRGKLNLSHISYLILDECDEMLDMGFIRDIDKILSHIKNKHQTGLFSATISKEIKALAKKYISPDAKSVKIVRKMNKENQIAQKYVRVKEEDKKDAIVSLLMQLSFKQAFIFCRTKHKVKQIAKMLADRTPFAVTCLHGNLSQNQRDKAMEDFRLRKCQVMVATDIAARGIDVAHVDTVINYDIPEQDEYYLHRIGRTGRVDDTGVSYTFINKSQIGMVKKYESMTNNIVEEYKLNLQKVEETNMDKYLESLSGLLNQDLSKEEQDISDAIKEYKEKLNKDVSLELIAASLLKKLKQEVSGERSFSEKHKEGIERNKERKLEKKMTFKSNPNAQRFFINIGAVDGMGEEDLIHFINKYAPEITKDDFSDIYIKGTFSFFEIPSEKTDVVMEKINNQTFGKREVHVELSERKENTRPGKKNFSRDGKVFNKDRVGNHSRGSSFEKRGYEKPSRDRGYSSGRSTKGRSTNRRTSHDRDRSFKGNR